MEKKHWGCLSISQSGAYLHFPELLCKIFIVFVLIWGYLCRFHHLYIELRSEFGRFPRFIEFNVLTVFSHLLSALYRQPEY